MAKRHTSQNKKQRLGQYFTTNSAEILSGYEHVVRGKQVMDPFAGECDLLNWATENGAVATAAYDIDPKQSHIAQNDSLVNPPDYAGYVLVSNPPYLAKNKCKGDKTAYIEWGESDYYKCHLASLNPRNCEEALVIIPSNFFCESRDGIRKRLFTTHHIVSAKYWNQPVFDDATTGICVLHLKRGRRAEQNFTLRLLPADINIEMNLKPEHGYLHGEEFFKLIATAGEFKAVKTDTGMAAPNTKIVVGLLDNGARPVGLSINQDADIYCRPTSFTTYQLTLPDYTLTLEEQKQAVELFNTKLQGYRKQYHDMFLANYMGPEQKILSRSYIHKLLKCVLDEMGIRPNNQNTDFGNGLFVTE